MTDDIKSQIEEIQTEIKKRLKIVRERFLGEKGTQVEMSRLVLNKTEKKSRSVWSDLENPNSRRNVGMKNLLSIAIKTGCSLDWLVFGKGEYNPVKNGKDELYDAPGWAKEKLGDKNTKVRTFPNKVGECKWCGAPIFSEGSWDHGATPKATYICDCRERFNK